MKSHTVIVGGGLTGILCALRLSKDKSLNDDEILLIDANDSLGGRFFFSNAVGSSKSGLGFEDVPLPDLDTLKRHLFLYLEEDERNFLDNFIQEKTLENAFNTLNPKRYFIKKEILDARYLLLSNSEFLTKKEAEALQSIVYFDKNENFEKEKDTILEQSAFWKNFGKNVQENILPILECTLGKNVLTLPLNVACEKLKIIFQDHAIYNDPFFLRTSEIEWALHHILHARNVGMKLKCTLKSIQEYSEGYDLCIINENSNDNENKSNSHLFANQIIFTIPPYNIRNLLPKQDFPSELGRFIAKVQPTSSLCLEIHDFPNKLLDDMQNKFQTLDTLYFPVEGVKAIVTSDARLVFLSELDYETSLQAPAVRESLTRLRRAARRLLKSEFSEELKKGAFIRKSAPFEKIILLSIAHNLPDHIQISKLSDLKDVKFSIPNVYAAGDYYYSLGDTTWRRIVKSVEQVVGAMSHPTANPRDSDSMIKAKLQ